MNCDITDIFFLSALKNIQSLCGATNSIITSSHCLHDFTQENRLAQECCGKLTWVLSSTTPLDETDDEEDQDDKGDGAHQSDEPALRGYVYLVYVGWSRVRETNKTRQWTRKKNAKRVSIYLRRVRVNPLTHPRALSRRQQLRTNMSSFPQKHDPVHVK